MHASEIIEERGIEERLNLCSPVGAALFSFERDGGVTDAFFFWFQHYNEVTSIRFANFVLH